MARKSLRDKQIGDELIVILTDTQFIGIVRSYTVYDPNEYIKNPTGLENDLSGVKDGLDVEVIIIPKF